MAFVRGSTNNLTIDDADLTLLNGNVHARGLTIAGIQVSVTHGLQTVSNVSNSTSNTIQFTNDTTGFVTTANAEIGKDLLVSGNVHVSSNASIAVDSNIVAEYTGPHGRGVATLKKYPEIIFEDGKFDANDTTNTYTQAGYTVTANATHENRAHEPWVIFNGNFTANDEWQISTNLGGDRYSETDGTYNSGVDLAGSTVADQTYNGDWVQVSLPQRIKLSHMNLGTGVDYGDSRMPEEGVLLGSNNGTTWSNVLAFGQTSYQHSVFTKIDVNSSDYYSYYRMIWLKITAGNDSTHRNRASLALWELYGYEEDPPTGDTSIDTTFTSVMNTPQTGGVKVYVDGPTLENKVTGPTPVGTSATYNSTDKYWELTGTLVSNISVEANTFLEGDAPHSVSVWFNSSNLEANASKSCVFSVSDQEKLDSQNLDIQSNTWHNLTYAYQGEGGSRVTYLDGRKVAEDQAEDTFGDYPPFAMTGYSQGGYVVSASSEYGTAYKAHEAFNGTFADNGDAWLCGNLLYDSGTGTYNGNANLGSDSGGVATPENGEWLKLEMPHKFVLDYISICGSTATGVNPKDWKIYGSNDDKNWDVLLSKTNAITAAYNSGGGKGHVVGASKAYKYFALVVTKSGGLSGNHYIQVGELEFYGHRENDLVRLPDPTNVLKYPHIAMTGPAQRGYVASASTTYSLYEPWEAFNGVSDAGGNNYWSGANSLYSGTGTFNFIGSGNPYETSVSGTTYTGDWLQIELPHKIRVDHVLFDVVSVDRFPRQGVYAGSNDGSTWFELHTFSGLTTTVQETRVPSSGSFNGSSASNAYKYIRLIITHNNGGGYAGCDELKIFGTGVDSIPIQVGGGNIDRVANFRVYDKCIDENQALEIWDAQKDEFGRAKSSVTLHKGRLGLGTTEPEGRLAVLDEPRGLEEFPPRAMTAEETYMEGHGVFRASSEWNRNSDYEPFAAFNKYTNDINAIVSQDRMWWSSIDTFTGNPGVFNGDTSKNIGGYTGVGLKLELPYSILCSRIDLYPRNPYGAPPYSQNPRAFKFIASKDNEFWDLLHEETNFVDVGSTAHPFYINTTQYYKYFAIVVTGVAGNTTLVSIVDLQFFGTREQGQSVLHDGQLTLTKNLNVPRIGPALDADDTPRRDRLIVEYNTSTNPTFEGAVRDTSGRGNDGVFYGTNMNYSSTEKALIFNGTDDHTRSGILTNMSGDKAVSYSLWIKADTLVNTMIVSLGEAGVYGIDGKTGGVFMASTGTLYNTVFGNGIQVTGAITVGSWIHIVATKIPGGSGITTQTLYVNGVKPTQSNWGTAGTSLSLDDPVITLGASPTFNQRFNGSISNFKLYDCALTAEEVKTLYDMGRLGGKANPQPLHISGPINVMGDIRYITNIRPLPKQTMWDHEANGHFTRGIYPITGTQGGSKVYNMLCEPDWCGGGWMCAAQIPRGKDVVTTTINLFEDEYGDPSNLTWSSDFAVPMNIFSNNSGYDLDVMLVLLGGTQAGRAGAGGARNGGIYRGVNLTQALNTGWPTNGVYPAYITTSGLASSADGYNFVSRTASGSNFLPHKSNTGWRLSFSSPGNYSMAYNDANINTMGWLIHTNGNNLQYTYSFVHGGGGAQDQSGGNTSWAAVRFFVRPKRY